MTDKTTPIDETQLFASCTPEEIEHRCAQGWELVSTHKREKLEPYSIQETLPANPSAGRHYDSTQFIQRYKVVMGRVCIIRKGKDRRVAELTDAVAAEQTKSREGEKAAREAQTKQAALEKQSAELEERLARLSKDKDIVAELRDQARAALRKMEAHLGKVRTAIGQKAFDEILAPKT